MLDQSDGGTVMEHDNEIDLRDMFFHILYKWRSILLVALFFCVFVGGYKLLRYAMLSQIETPKDIREYELALAEYNLSQDTYERYITNWESQIEQQKVYMENSVLMKINPYRKPTASADIFIKLDEIEWGILPDNINLDPTDSLIRIYTSNFSSNLDWEPIETLTGQSALYLKELLWLGTDYNSNTFTISVTHYDGDTAQEILEIILDQLIAKYQNMGSDVNKHTLSIVNRSLTYSIDNSLVDTQKNNEDIITNYEQNIINYQRALEELEAPIPLSVMRFIKYFVIGFILGIFLTIFFHGMAYILDGRLHTEDELKRKYGYRLLGVIPKFVKGNIFSGIDRFLHSLNKSERQISECEAYNLMAVNVKNTTGKHTKILITGTIESIKLESLVKNIAPQLNQYTFSFARDLSHISDSLKALQECDAVIIAEETSYSLLADIQRNHECITSLDKPVLGYILF